MFSKDSKSIVKHFIANIVMTMKSRYLRYEYIIRRSQNTKLLKNKAVSDVSLKNYFYIITVTLAAIGQNVSLIIPQTQN